MNKFTKLLKIEHAIVQGPFGGGYSSVSLAGAVSNAGGLGSFGANHLSQQQILEVNQQLKAATKAPYSINLWIKNEQYAKEYSEQDFEKTKAVFQPFFDALGVAMPDKPELPTTQQYEQQIEAILEAKPPVFSFVYGVPEAAVLRALQQRGIFTLGAATTVEEALEIEEAGIDAVVATGFEAGGHRVAFLDAPENQLMGTFSLVPRVADAVNIPVVAAGGVADRRGIQAARALGADAVQIGTAFLACKESNAPDIHRRALFGPEAEKTVLTKSLTGRLARGTQGQWAELTKNSWDDLAPYPIQGLFIRPLRAAAIAQGRTDLLTFWAGQSAPLLSKIDAQSLMEALTKP